MGDQPLEPYRRPCTHLFNSPRKGSSAGWRQGPQGPGRVTYHYTNSGFQLGSFHRIGFTADDGALYSPWKQPWSIADIWGTHPLDLGFIEVGQAERSTRGPANETGRLSEFEC